MENRSLWVSSPVQNESNLEEVKHSLIPEYIRKNCDKFGWDDVVAFESGETGRKYTQRQVIQSGRTFAAGLIKLGPKLNLKRQDVVAVILPNMPEYPSVLLGIWEAGLIACLINPTSTEYELSHELEATCSKIIITTSKTLPQARTLKEKYAMIQKIIVVDHGPNEVDEDTLNYFDMLETDTNGVEFFTGSQLTTENDVAVILFSSGTSGRPKGVVLTHFCLLSNAVLFIETPVTHEQHMDIVKKQRIIGVLPFFHIFGLTMTIIVSMLQGTHVTTMSSFVPATFIQLLRQTKPTILYSVPTILSFVCNADSIGSLELESVHSIFCGSTAAGEALVKRALNKAKNATFHEGYGLTETSPVVTRTHFQKTGSVGQPLPGTTLKVVDILTRATVGPNERGEICAKTPSIMKGYLNNEEATKECIDEDGWFHTGDIGYYDEEGCFYIVDRLKELIKVKSFQVSPSELEDLIRSHEKVADVAVIGIPHEKFGEAPRAYVVVKKDQVVTEEDITNLVHSKVSSYKHLIGGIEFVSEIPKGGSGKILRRVLKERYAAHLGQP